MHPPYTPAGTTAESCTIVTDALPEKSIDVSAMLIMLPAIVAEALPDMEYWLAIIEPLMVPKLPLMLTEE